MVVCSGEVELSGISLDGGLLLHPALFVLVFGVCVVFNLLSVLIPHGWSHIVILQLPLKENRRKGKMIKSFYSDKCGTKGHAKCMGVGLNRLLFLSCYGTDRSGL